MAKFKGEFVSEEMVLSNANQVGDDGELINV